MMNKRITIFLNDLAGALHSYWAKGNEDEKLRIIIEDDLLFEHSKEVARLVASKPPKAISFMKLNINQASEDNFETCLDWEAVRQIHCMETKDFSEGVSAFQEKRKPKFMGM